MKVFNRDRVPAIRPEQWKKAAPLFIGIGTTVEPDQLAKAAGISERLALAILLGLAGDGLADLNLMVFHCSNRFAAVRPMGKGFQPTPWTCPQCGKRVGNPDDLRYAIRAVLRSSISFE